MVSSQENYVFGHGATLPLPLTLDRVMEEQSLTSTLPLFRLPIELFHHVTRYLSRSDLQSLALVDRDSNQLARTCLFSSIKLDYGDSSMQLLESIRRQWSSSVDPYAPKLGSCIRRLTVTTNLSFATSRDGTDLQVLMRLSEDVRHDHLLRAEQAQRRYFILICEVIRDALPNLQILDWDTIHPMTPAMLRCIAASPIKHLRFNRVQITEEFLVESTWKHRWELETLVINVSWLYSERIPGDTAPLVRSLIQQASPTLRQLVWKGEVNPAGTYIHSFPSPIYFPYLRRVVLDTVRACDSSVLTSLLGPAGTVRSLFIDSASHINSEFLRTCGTINSLESFCWINHLISSYNDILVFLGQNSHIQHLDTVYSLPSPIIKSLLDLVHQGFYQLTSLHLTWEGTVIPTESLMHIGTINTLRHLWISAGTQCGWRYDWEINHDDVQDAFKTLSLLETLAFSRDSYRCDGHPLLDPSVYGYFSNKILPGGIVFSDYLSNDELDEFRGEGVDFDEALLLRNKMMALIWERCHQSRMVGVASMYFQTFPRLNWCYVGQLAVATELQGAPVLKTKARDEYLVSLKRKWGICDDLAL
ncbi:hypothetical protein BDQ12DRAFT_524801 [Crucibulum laeve]|uniref:F-box domain-containing protein n=1 Tax=Crucibulum laeve TaxID=68775 RepID=A0A5C3LGE1_9AGAR|nr:hypothetical protein BDQ12DRAFT_524801 [Crucibulum laeve]